jgi:hypothetical protein
MKNTALFGCLFIVAVVILVPLDISTIKRGDQVEKIQTSTLLAKVDTLAIGKIQKITITPDELSSQQFQTEITSQDDIQYVMGLLSHADTNSGGGHNTPIYECTLTFATSTDTSRFLVSARQYDPNDGYMTDLFYTKLSNGTYIRGNPPTIRVPDLGRWLMQREPKGAR